MASSTTISRALLPSSLTLLTLFFSFQYLNCYQLAVGHGDSAEGGGGAADLRSKGLILVKIWCLIILFASTFAGGISPYFYRWNESFLLLGTQFAGGVFLGTSLMHFLSDSNGTFGDLTPKSYPFAFMLASAGYLLTMLGDCIVVWITRDQGAGDDQRKVDADDGEEGGSAAASAAAVVKVEELPQHPAFAKTTSLGDTVLLILALCFHSVFEGIAVGVAGTYAANILDRVK